MNCFVGIVQSLEMYRNLRTHSSDLEKEMLLSC